MAADAEAHRSDARAGKVAQIAAHPEGTLVLWSAGTGAWAASRRYLMIHLLGGVVLFGGPEDTGFGALQEQSRVWLEAKASF